MLSSASARLQSSSDLSFFSSSKPVASTNTVVVTTRLARRPAQQQLTANSTSTKYPSVPPSTTTTPQSDFYTQPKKRKPADSEHTTALPREVKRLRTVSEHKKQTKRKSNTSSKPSSRTHSRQSTLAPSPEPIYRSRSTSLFTTSEIETPISNRCWGTNEDGEPSPSHISSEMVVKNLMKSYKGYFRNLQDPDDKSFEPHPTNYPVVELEYPNNGAIERFILLAPRDKDHYNPVMDLERSLIVIIECYLTPKQQALFGPLPSDNLAEAISPPPSPSPSPSQSPASSASTSSLSSVDSSSSLSSLTSLSSTNSTSSPPSIPLLRAIQRAIHTRDGPLFLRAMARINHILHSLKYPRIPTDLFAPAPRNKFRNAVDTWRENGLPKKVLMRIIEENYQRCVGPNVQSLKRYEAFSSTVYGELMPSLAHEIIRITKLKEDSIFLDLGSGVGNVVVQASLQTGCQSFGIELMPHPARVARDMVEQIKIRCRMWGISIGEMELEEGNMLTSRRVDELIAKADVVLVDNKVFEESLNEALRPKFLDLKEGAIVISLSPFVNSLNARVTERNVDDISAIFDVTERPYHSGSVSWGNNGGSYYIHRVDREGYSKIRKRFETSRSNSGRSVRSKR